MSQNVYCATLNNRGRYVYITVCCARRALGAGACYGVAPFWMGWGGGLMGCVLIYVYIPLPHFSQKSFFRPHTHVLKHTNTSKYATIHILSPLYAHVAWKTTKLSSRNLECHTRAYNASYAITACVLYFLLLSMACVYVYIVVCLGYASK